MAPRPSSCSLLLRRRSPLVRLGRLARTREQRQQAHPAERGPQRGASHGATDGVVRPWVSGGGGPPGTAAWAEGRG